MYKTPLTNLVSASDAGTICQGTGIQQHPVLYRRRSEWDNVPAPRVPADDLGYTVRSGQACHCKGYVAVWQGLPSGRFHAGAETGLCRDAESAGHPEGAAFRTGCYHPAAGASRILTSTITSLEKLKGRKRTEQSPKSDEKTGSWRQLNCQLPNVRRCIPKAYIPMDTCGSSSSCGDIRRTP